VSPGPGRVPRGPRTHDGGGPAVSGAAPTSWRELVRPGAAAVYRAPCPGYSTTVLAWVCVLDLV
jgi:hypothetical protein